MTVRFIYKVIPIFVFYTNWFVPKRFSAYNYWVFIVVRPDLKANEFLLKHELVHSKQCYRTLGIHSILYYLNSNYRFKSELEAYNEQMKHEHYSTEVIQWVCSSLYRNYSLNYNFQQVKDKVLRYILKVK